MTEVITEWIAKAEGDFATATRENSVVMEPNCDDVCFHAQQCIEKLLKALLVADGIQPPKTHDLIALGELLRPQHADLELPLEDLLRLSRAGVVFRCPGETATPEMAAAALAICTRLRERLLALFRSSDD